MNYFHIGERVRLEKWIAVPPFTTKTGVVESIDTDGKYTVILAIGVKEELEVSGLLESDLISLRMEDAIKPESLT